MNIISNIKIANPCLNKCSDFKDEKRPRSYVPVAVLCWYTDPESGCGHPGIRIMKWNSSQSQGTPTGLRLRKTSRGFLTLCYIMKTNGKVGAVASDRLN